MRQEKPTTFIDKFLGIVNTHDPTRLPEGALVSAVNVDVTDIQDIHLRSGYTAFGTFGAVAAAYATDNEQRFFVIESGDLKEVFDDGGSAILASGFTDAEAYWTEAGGRVFLSGPGYGFIERGEWHEWGIPTTEAPLVQLIPGDLPCGRYLVAAVHKASDGRQGGMKTSTLVEIKEDGQGLRITPYIEPGYEAVIYISSVNGEDLYKLATIDSGHLDFVTGYGEQTHPLDKVQMYTYPPVSGGPICFCNGRVYMAKEFEGDTVIFWSQPFALHLFDLYKDSITVSGVVTMMECVEGKLVIGTDREIWLYDIDSGLQQLADYGVPKGQPGAKDHRQHKLYFWTDRGVCRALPFENVMEERFLLDKFSRAHVRVFAENGKDRLITLGRET